MLKLFQKPNFLLITAAIIWGFAFVAQRKGMESIGPFTFNAIRFFLGGLVLLPLISRFNKPEYKRFSKKKIYQAALLLGLFLFLGSSFQQVGIVFTTAGKAGFITGMYVVIVPILGFFIFKMKSNWANFIGALIAIAGLYLLSINDDFLIEFGDFLVLLCALFFAIHVLLIGLFAPKINPIFLASMQCFICSFFSLIIALSFENIELNQIILVIGPLLYAGILSSGCAYALQLLAQDRAHPSHAAIILSSEAIFAVIGGCFFLSEPFGIKMAIGCILMLCGMLVSQLKGKTVNPHDI
ncbi:MAG: DMT family transporter [Pseudomonadota bacterium]